MNAANLKLREILGLLLVHGAVYEQKFEFIDKETGQLVSKIHRYNDTAGDTPEKFILSLVPLPVPPIP